MTARTPAPENEAATAHEPTAEQLEALQAAIDDAVATALEEQQKASARKASRTPAQVVSVVEEPLGRVYLSKSDFVPLWDKDGEELPPVPKHWGPDQLPLGATKKKPAPKSGE